MHYDHQFKKDNVSPHNEYSIAVQSALLLELSPFYIKDDKKLSNMKINEIREIWRKCNFFRMIINVYVFVITITN